MRIFLVGYMGCGKSTIGRKLSRRLVFPFVDTDRTIELSEGATVAELFADRGESAFRELERAAIEGLVADSEQVVVSTGGGVPLWQDNMEYLNAEGMTIYLKRSVDNIISRLSPYGREKRPRIKGLGDSELRDFMISDMAAREARYSCSQLIIDADHLSDHNIVETIIDSL